MDNASADRRSNRNTNRYSVNHLFSMRAEQDVEIEDDLARGALLFQSPAIGLRARVAALLARPAVTLYTDYFIRLLAQKRLRELKARISSQSKKNFVFERDVRYLDSRIALLIQNRMALDEVS